MNILYIHHNGVLGGAAKSLLELINAFPQATVSAYVICPIGPAADEFERIGCKVIRTMGISIFDHSRLGHYRGWRWLILIRELLFMPFTVAAIVKGRWQWPKIDVVHVNEYYLLLPVIVCQWLFRCPIIVHSRSVQERWRGSLRRSLFRWYIKKYVDKVIAIDDDVLKSQIVKADVRVIYNGFSIEELGPVIEKLTGSSVTDGFVVGFVGIFHEYKGVFDLIKCAELCQKRQYKVHFVFCGDIAQNKRMLNLGRKPVVEKMRQMIETENLSNVSILPYEKDLQKIYSKIDVLCFPSHLEAVGRPVFEAGFFDKPSIVALSHDSQELFFDGVSGIRVRPEDPEEIFKAVEKLYMDPSLCKKMGYEAGKLARSRFDIHKNALQVLDIYREVIKR